MKKLMTLMLGLSLAIGAVTAFAQTKKDDTTTKKGGGKRNPKKDSSKTGN